MSFFRHLSIKSKLIVMLLAVSGCSILVTAYIGYQSGKSNLTDRVFNQLTSLRASKAYQVESYFKTIRNHIQTLSNDLTVTLAMQEFAATYQDMGAVQLPPSLDPPLTSYYRQEFLTRLAKVEKGIPVLDAYLPKDAASRYLQYQYIAANPHPVGKKHLLTQAKDGSAYSRIHARYHPIFREIIEKFGYYDLFLINLEGTIVYTVYKETDFTTNLTTGPYSDSNLARLVAEVRRAKEQGYARIIDFEPYAPSYQAPAAFIAAPIFHQSKLVGMLAIQLPVNEMNTVMTGNRNWERDGLGKTGETYLVGRDYRMRTVSRFLEEDPEGYAKTLRTLGVSETTIKRIRQYGTSILQQEVRTIAVEKALAGQQGTQIIQDYRGIPVLSSYAPLRIDDLEWVILSEMDLAEAYAPIYGFGHQVLVSATLLMLLVTLLAMGLAYLFVKPVNQIIATARQVEAGHLDAITFFETEDELGELARSFNSMVENLRAQTQFVEEKRQENEKLLLSLFPAAIARRLQRGEKEIAENVPNVTILFADLTGFSRLSAALPAEEVVAILNDIVTAFDEAAERYGVEKIKTIGDSYMAICGLSIPYLDHDRRAIDFAAEILLITRRFSHERGLSLNIQIGINSGDIVAGLIGRSRVLYDVWGDAVNIASALRETCPAGAILASDKVYNRLHDLYEFEPAGEVDTHGKAKIKAWKLKNVQYSLRVES
ncbi:adenylate/guanylate cyclase domain-containing protein [Leptolyngbya sp. 'hensonii']|uniref:adenylate/guanylate cyclase domain-containing protein n=1 Tax=Leptolyngbya sp. 'hensonii' TaxID=1922337 RepID=UPI0009501B26|nr:adenylate/guanylate cyclase domain-containing protein [Leptolyngbya sp. 'hensonii']OLP15772.1 adenylate/guanylate cyclase domain-containing protein [Leptolyngbya sp. 'hensonii']